MGKLWRYWLLGSALVETLLFSGCLLGWNSLSPILTEQRVLSKHCQSGLTSPVTVDRAHTGPHSGLPPPICITQERHLNLGFTLGSLLLGASFLPLQLLMGYAYLRTVRQAGGALVSASCLMLAYSCTNPNSLSSFLPCALISLGVGGSCILFTSLMIPLFLADVGYLYSSLVLGCFSASAAMFTLIKVTYISGVPFVPLILGFGALSCGTFLNSFFCWNLDENRKWEKERYRDSVYSSLFGALQMVGLFTAPLISMLLRNRQPHKTVRKRWRSHSPCSIRRLCVGLILRILAVSGFGISCLIPSLEVQVLAFVLHVSIRSATFIFSSMLYGCVFPDSHFGALFGIHTLISFLPTLSQHPLFLLLTSILQGDPFWIHSMFFALSALLIPVPLALWISKGRKPLCRPIVLRQLSQRCDP
ncbi:large neutral amino acids transporter small subunit 4-like [Rhinophrynus dorsalis]